MAATNRRSNAAVNAAARKDQINARVESIDAHCRSVFRIRARVERIRSEDVPLLGAKRKARIEVLLNLVTEQCELSHAEAVATRKTILEG